MNSADQSPQDALHKISTLSRDVPYADVKDLVRLVLSCPRTRLNLPVLIIFLRNHAKSFGPGVGAGEKCVPLKLLCALFEEDPFIATALLKDITNYGSWVSLLRLLQMTDDIGASSDAQNYHPSTHLRFRNLQQAIYQRFSEQMKADDEITRGDGPCSGVSNASKFAPHEGRGGFNSYHADCIANLLFVGVELDVSQDVRKYKLRKLYRKLRTKLNAANGHIAEVIITSCVTASVLPFDGA
jgi:hypothetical protein